MFFITSRQGLFALLLLLMFPLASYAGEWISDKETGCQVWNPGPVPGESVKWSGDCLNGKAAGKGTLQWFKDESPTDRYEGEYRDGQMDGKGTFNASNGYRYEGDFLDDKRTGKGIYTWPNGDRYEGDFLDGKLSGKGTMTFADGDRYEGDFLDNKRTGKGIYTWPNGNRYEGDFLDGKLSGKGTMTYADGSRYEGDWLDDKEHRTYRYSGYKSVVYGHIDKKKILDVTDPSDEYVVFLSINGYKPAMLPQDKKDNWMRNIKLSFQGSKEFVSIDTEKKDLYFARSTTGSSWEMKRSWPIPGNSLEMAFLAKKDGTIDVFTSVYLFTIELPSPLNVNAIELMFIGSEASYEVITTTASANPSIFAKVRDELTQNKNKVLAERSRASSGIVFNDRRQRREDTLLEKLVVGAVVGYAAIAVAGAADCLVGGNKLGSCGGSKSASSSDSKNEVAPTKDENKVAESTQASPKKSGHGGVSYFKFLEVQNNVDHESTYDFRCADGKRFGYILCKSENKCRLSDILHVYRKKSARELADELCL